MDRDQFVSRRIAAVAGSVAGFLLVFMVWQAVVHAEQHRVAGAVRNGQHLWQLERVLHLPNEAVVVSRVRSVAWLWSVAGWYYVLAHPVVIVATLAVVAWIGHGLYRQAFATFGVTAVACFLVQLWPTAPPRWLPAGGGPAPGQALTEYHSLGALANQVASFPSVHVAWAACVALTLHQLPRLRRYGWTHLALTVAVVVATSNHTWLDSAAGIAIAYGAHRVTRRVTASAGAGRDGLCDAAAGGVVSLPVTVRSRRIGRTLSYGGVAPAPVVGAVPRLRDEFLQPLVGGGDVGRQSVVGSAAPPGAEPGRPGRLTPVTRRRQVSRAVVADGWLPVVRHGSLPVSCDECEGALPHLGRQLQRGVEGGFEVPAAAVRPAHAGDQDVVAGLLGAGPDSARVEDRGELHDLVALVDGHGVSFAAPLDAAGLVPAGYRRGAWPKRLAVKGADVGGGTPSLDGETGRATRLPHDDSAAVGGS
ncbi:MAG TPA: phosphatase PAP2 family protein [Amycolatopsis sp.]|nr:phosphatase PAP2 family protein [Amycolatopsis sp.]